MKLGIDIINHGRPRILELCLASIKRLQREIEEEIIPVVVSEDDLDLCGQYGVHHIRRANKPVNQKWNKGAQWLRTQEVDYVMISGSDDVYSTELIRNIFAEMHNGTSLIGILDVHFYGTYGAYKNNLFKLSCKNMAGVAKTISKEIMDKIEWNPCKVERNHGMDGIISKTIAPYVTTTAIVNGMCVDVKSPDSMNRITLWGRKIKNSLDPQTFYDILSPEELKILMSI